MNDTFLPGSGFDTYESQDKVLMQMDGSTEAAVAVRILQQQGFAVVGAVVRLAPEQAEAAQRAKKAAEALGIECILLNAEALAQQPEAAGAWPQFAALLTAADKLGIQYIGSSSRARLEVGTDGVHTVLPPVDAARDDSTALAALPQETLARLLLPLGEFDAGDLAELAQELQLADNFFQSSLFRDAKKAPLLRCLLLWIKVLCLSRSGGARCRASPDRRAPGRGSAPRQWRCWWPWGCCAHRTGAAESSRWARWALH